MPKDDLSAKRVGDLVLVETKTGKENRAADNAVVSWTEATPAGVKISV
jgi:hypothetical protein